MGDPAAYSNRIHVCSSVGALYAKDYSYTAKAIEGDHFVYTKKGVMRPVVIPDWPEVPVFIIKNNLRTAGISRQEYFSLLEKIK